jgi:hypothetical protein
MVTKTVNLQERVEEVENERLPEISERQEEIVSEAQDYEEGGDSIPASLEDEFDELESERVEISGEAKTLKRAIQDWEGAEFQLQELTFGQVQQISDDVMEQSFEVDVQSQNMTGAPKQGFYQIEVLRRSIASTPPEAPDDPAEYPTAIGEYLFERVNALNTVGDTDMGNSSLRERMKSNSGR